MRGDDVPSALTQYDPLGHVTQVTEADGYSIGFDRDPMGRVTGAYNQEGHRVSLALDADGRPRSSTDPNNLTTSYDYYHASEDGRLKRTTQPKVTGQTQGKAVEVASYDGAGRPTRINAVAADGSVRDGYRFYDELGRLTREVGPQVSATDTSRPVTCYVYSVLSDVKEIWAGATTDTVSNLFNTTVLSSHLYSLDQQGRRAGQTEIIGGVTKTWSYGYDIFGNRRSKTKAGTTTAYLYDAAHQLSAFRSGSDIRETRP